MNQFSKIMLATSLSATMMLGAVTVTQSDDSAQAATQYQKPYYTYKGVFNYQDNNALRDKTFYNALKNDNFKYENLKVGESTQEDVENALGSNLKKYYQEKGITYYERNDIIVGIKDGKLVDLTLLVDKVKNSSQDMASHVKKGEVYDTDSTYVAFYRGNSIVIKSKTISQK
ncbi:immunodominant staphylococcal antigen IsaB family protein [Staphylococcus felis]|uniref:Immunodominant staphylococcal antigen B n=2 Tax=Staphylococcus felis TaxID=46127 RepID=A0A3E0INH8_9STAP|nr:hypothetical protein [Staphylococcus felis]REH78949.1 hypothetical protein DOS57_03940 [Staphylococcus felis]REH93615.1 hypothetical protein DOS83_08665 [Staphylococcus felis]REI12821.1 hypothetical protein DOS73_08975 [Staphylococcus felis]